MAGHRRATLASDPSLTRKVKKCMVEKRRRERMERAMDTIKFIILEAFGRQPSDYEKMEKADILDLALKFMQMTQPGAVRVRSRAPSLVSPRQPAVMAAERRPSLISPWRPPVMTSYSPSSAVSSGGCDQQRHLETSQDDDPRDLNNNSNDMEDNNIDENNNVDVVDNNNRPDGALDMTMTSLAGNQSSSPRDSRSPDITWQPF